MKKKFNPFKPIKIKPMKVHFNLDTDGDKLADWKDCKPFDKHRQGFDVYLKWTGQRDLDKELFDAIKAGHDINSPKIGKILDAMPSAGKEGYLRGSYAGGYADQLDYLFGFYNLASQQKTFPFGPAEQEEFKKRLDEITVVRARRPSAGDTLYGPLLGYDPQPTSKVSDKFIQECNDFWHLARKLTSQKKKLWVQISR